MDNHNSNYQYYLESPIGILEIVSDGVAINSINFVEQKGNDSQEKSEITTICIEELNAYFEGKINTFSFKIEQKGTDFQQVVWNELIKIPLGNTISYLELSRKIGNEKAIRAVGTTNGKNQLAIVVPCHRVIGSDGSMTGYAGGIWRKEWLLAHERKIKGVGGEQLNMF